MVDPSIVILLIFGVLLLLGVPIGTSLGIASIFAIWYYDYGLAVVGPNLYSSIAKFPLLAIPFFVTAGVTMQESGIAEKIIKLAKLLIGNIYGGLAIVGVVVATFWGAVSGSGPATTAALGVILIPALIASGYSKGFSAGVISTASGLAIIIPPSIAFIIYGVITSVSIGALFIGGILPGLVVSFLLIITTYVVSKRREWRGGSEERTIQEIMVAFKEAILGLIAPIIILGGIYGGVFTPTEAAVVAVVYSWFIGAVVYKTITFKKFLKILRDSVETSAVVMFVVAFATLFSWTEQTAGLIDKAVQAIIGFSSSPIVIMLLINIMLLIAGMFLDAISIYYVFLPIFMPIMAHFNWDPLWFGVIMTINLAIGQVTPPVAVNAYVAANIAKTSLEDIAREALPLIIAAIIGLLIAIFFPQLSLWLPERAGLY
ncbi:TRAP transporter large permease [Thermococcus sp. MV5]|uniref:TRAP transporter large permease n=1 Tax=Thermococcus sp. MV5 TaxID=1638272 RepID=UPI00143909BF|nr:TRAP transporter large permease [Thermococcus sp. MV5]NJE26578.1 TRAP transporter large permease [Thermococcus sp. MV5]